ncbi:MAG: barstar family protein [Dehalococcoidia bacterium]|nr:barstar family protein [Dehalococcoidia bacterium]
MDFDLLFRAQRPALYTIAAEAEDLDALFADARDAVADGDEGVYRLRGAKCRSLQGFFDEIGAVMQLPLSFGETWDALDDLVENEGYLPGTAIFIADADQLLADADPRELRNFIALMDSCNTHYLGPGYAASHTAGTGFHAVLQAGEDAVEEFEARIRGVGGETARIEP